jgi:hypothetical protein
MKKLIFCLLAGTIIFTGCTSSTTNLNIEPDPFVKPSKPTAGYVMTYRFETPTFTKNMTVNQAYSLTFKASCLLQDSKSDQDLIALSDPKLGTTKLFYTANDGTNRKELGSGEFVNGTAPVPFTPTEAGSFVMRSEVVIDGTAYSGADVAARKTALESKCKQLIAADARFAAISNQYDVATTFLVSGSTGFGTTVTFQ